MRTLAHKVEGKKDSELVSYYRNSGNISYAGVLFQRYTHLISAVAFKYLNDKTESEDAVMEIFEILIKDLRQYDIKNFKSWLYSITKHYCLRKKQEMKRFESIEEINLLAGRMFGEEQDEFEYQERINHENNIQKLVPAINSLSDEQKSCIELYYLENKSYREVAEATGYSLLQVKSYLQNGKRNLYNYLNGNR